MREKSDLVKPISSPISLLAINWPTGGGVTSIGQLVSNLLTPIYGSVGIALFGLLLYGGFTWLTSAGDPDKIRKAVDTMFNAVIGVAIVIFAFIATKVVGGILGYDLI